MLGILHAKEVIVVGGGERRWRYILCYNPKEATCPYKRYLRVTKNDMIRIDRGAIRQAAAYDGTRVPQANDDTIRPVRISPVVLASQTIWRAA